jgi:DNA-binding beta-propeller fold protein YncE
MKWRRYYSVILFLIAACQSAAPNNSGNLHKLPILLLAADTIITPKKYDSLQYEKMETVFSAPGTKSVLFNAAGSKLYAMNLEGMSVYEFDRLSRKVTREFKFHATRGIGWDYSKSKPIESYQEKPVEACLTHNDRILWVSLHNAEGIVPIWVDDIKNNRITSSDSQIVKPVTVIYPGTTQKDSFYVPLINTGKTPKVIARTIDNQHLLVSNWHSHTVSILGMNEKQFPFGFVNNTISVSAIPRGIAIDQKNNRSYVAIMGGSSIAVINNRNWVIDTILNVASNPRHLVLDSSGHLFVSYNGLGTIACLDASSGNTLFTTPTHAKPRTITLSGNKQFLFVTCYTGDMVDVYKINSDSFLKIASLPCKGHPVGVDVYEDDNKLEAWVCCYNTGSINIYTFKKR